MVSGISSSLELGTGALEATSSDLRYVSEGPTVQFGSFTSTVVPIPNVLLTFIAPPCSSTRLLTITSPRPVPGSDCDLPPENRSNSRVRVLESQKGEIWHAGSTHLNRSLASCARLKLHSPRGRQYLRQPAVSGSQIKPTTAVGESTVVSPLNRLSA